MRNLKKLTTAFHLSLAGILSCLLASCDLPFLNSSSKEEIVPELTATFTQTREVYNNDDLDSIRDMLVVTLGNASSETTEIEDYTLSGAFEVGESVITVNYEYSLSDTTTTLSDDFTVVVSQATHTHTYTNYISNNDATCTEDGTKTAVCDFETCTKTHTVTVEGSKFNHSYINYISDGNATCTEDGTKTAVCENGCNTRDTIADVDSKFNHSYVNYIPDGNATCTEDGTKTAVCENGCNTRDTIADVGSKFNHSYINYVPDGNATCTEDGTKTAVCENGCNTRDTIADVGSKFNHSYINYIPDGNATCMADGTKTAVCENGCNTRDTIADEGSQTDHKFTNYTANNDATCTEDGTKTASCHYDCGETDTTTDENSALGHKFQKSECIRCEETNYLTITKAPSINNFYYGETVSVKAGVITDELGATVTNGTWSAITDIPVVGNTYNIPVEVEVTFLPNGDEYAPVTTTVKTVSPAVALYEDEYYSTVDAALAQANQANEGTVYVLPLGYTVETGRAKIAKTIATTQEVVAGVTLCLPYSDNDFDLLVSYLKATSTNYNTCSFGSANYLVNQLFIAEGHTLVNRGTLNIAGEVSGGLANYYLSNANAASSVTAGLHAQLNLEANAKLTNAGEINCYGFINETSKNNGSEVVMESGRATVVFSIVEHLDSNAYIGMVNPESSKVRDAAKNAALNGMNLDETSNNVGNFTPDSLQGAPFNRFYIASITAKTTVNYNANLAGFVDLYTYNTDNVATVNLVNNKDALITLTNESSYLVSKYDSATRKMDLDIYGDSKLSPINLNLYLTETKNISSLTATVKLEITLSTGPVGDSDGIYLPLSNYFDITLNAVNGSATVDMTGQKIKLLPGAKLTVGEGVTLNANSIAVYDNNNLFSSGIDKSYKTTTPAEFIVNGTLIVDSLGGKVKTQNNNARLTINKANSVVSKEIQSLTANQSVSIALTVLMYTASIDLDYSRVNYFSDKDCTLTATGTTVTAANTTLYPTTYHVENYKWVPDGLSISYDTAGGSQIDAEKALPTGYVIPSDINETKVPTRENYNFLGWYMDSNYKIPAAGQTINDFTTLYAKWEKMAGKILVTFETISSNAEDVTATKTFKTQEITQSNPKATIPAAANNFNCDPTYSRYVIGYYTDANGTHAFDFLQEITSDTVIYVKWADKVLLTVKSVQGDANTGMGGQQGKMPSFTVELKETESGTAYYTSAKINTDGDTTYYVIANHYATISGSDIASGAGTFQITGAKSLTVKGSKGGTSCIVEGTLITLADGSQKKVEDLTYADKVLVFNHYTGQMEEGYIAMLDHVNSEKQLYEVVNLVFSNGETLRIVWNHGVFNVTLNEYVFVNEDNYQSFVGHKFYSAKYVNGQFVNEIVTLTQAYVTEEVVKIYNPTTVTHMNYFASGILNVTAAPEVVCGHVNYFTLDENMKYDETKMQADIEKYGLYAYEDFQDVLTEEEFNALPFKYLKVSVGKGLITWNGIMAIINYLHSNALIG